jgi:hypothetical protein
MARSLALAALLSCAHLLAVHECAADVRRVQTREEFVAALASAEPGTEIRLAPGSYRGGISAAGLRGSESAPIVIAAANADDPPIIEGGGSGLHLSSPKYVEIDGLVFAKATGNGLNIDDGSDAATPAERVTIRNVVVRDVGPEGNRDGIKLSGVDHFRVENCCVERWGVGGSGVDMVGCHDGVVEGCTFAGPGGEQANGVQTKGGSSDVTVRRCRFEDCGGRGVNIGGSTGLEHFRPRDAAYEARNITVEDCEFLGGAAAVAFVGVDGAVVRHNTIYRPRRWAVRILQESQGERFAPCRNGRFEKNVIAFRASELRTAINVGGGTEPASFEFAGNMWACLDRPDQTRRLVSLPAEERDGAYGAPPEFEDAENGDVRLRDRSSLDVGPRPASE